MYRKTLAAALAIGLGLMSQAGWAAMPDRQAVGPDLMRDVQRSLNQKGYGVGAVDGVYGRTTHNAVTRFQRDNSLPVTGQIDHQTLAALGITGLTAGTESRQAMVPPGQTMSPRMVEDVQRELRRLGYDPGRVDGVWGGGTRRALSEFQRDRHLAQSGRIDEQTLSALEAGGATQTGELPGPRR